MIELLLSIDSNFVMQLMTTSVSLFRNNPNAQFQIHLLCTKVSESDKQRIREFIEGQGQRIVFYDADEVLLNLPHIPKSGRFTLSTYMRCFITRILPENISKILYMDCDILIRGNIDGLWNTDISGYAIGAVDDMWALRGNFERLGIPPEDSYFNNGVLLINLDYWRKADVYELSLQTIKEHHQKLQFHDQDIFNMLFHAKRLELPVQYNMQDAFFRMRRQWIQPRLQNDIDHFLASPTIVHYTGSHKPWEYKCYHPFRKEYLEYVGLTPYKGFKPKAKKWQDVVEILVNRVLWALHIIRRKYHC